MTLSRVLGAAGRTMIAAGVLLLLFVVYQLWGTGLRTAAAQDRLRGDFETRKAELAQAVTTTTTTSPATSTTTSDTNGAETSAETTSPPSTAPPAPAPRPGQAIGVIRIPRIGTDATMVEGVGLYDLSKGPGHFPSTPLPGQAGNAAIAGHRTTHGAPFHRIDELAPGDLIEVETFQGTFTYEVVPGGGVDPSSTAGHRIIEPDQIEILDQVPGRNTLTLMACHPKYDLKQRIVVVGRLTNPPAPDTPRPTGEPAPGELPGEPVPAPDEGDVLVGGDSSAWGPAIAWSALAGGVWLAAWLVARGWQSWRQWQRWAVFAAGVPVFAVPLFLAFESINRLLPAGY